MRFKNVLACLALELMVVTSFTQPVPLLLSTSMKGPSWSLFGSREDEIRRKIIKLKKEGKIKPKSDSNDKSVAPEAETTLDKLRRERKTMRDNPVLDAYQDKIAKKLGKKGKLYRNTSSLDSISKDTEDNDEDDELRVGSMKRDQEELENMTEDDLDDEELEMLEAVQEALDRKRREKAAAELAAGTTTASKTKDEMEELALQMEKEQMEKKTQAKSSDQSTEKVEEKTTSGVGGAWSGKNDSDVEIYRPANGGWGYFPRPKDISSAYGGGKKIGRDVVSSFEDEQRKQREIEETRRKLQQYREEVGIDVQSEKDHADEIAEALEIGQRAMQRGVYTAAVSSLEKVTKYCSTNSKVGSQVFLELAMAYEAVGRTSEAIQVYQTLTTCRMENVKFNAKRLLYGIEAMQFMRDEAKVKSFSRKATTQTFVDTTGLANIAQNFDDRYNTAYVDLNKGGGYFRKLTENVVRSTREARQILLAATDAGEVDRLKIVQALRSLDRKFSETLAEEMKKNNEPEQVAYINGVPIRPKEEQDTIIPGPDSFTLGGIDTVLENIGGEWRLQLMADSKGDGVNFFNKTISWQKFNTEEMNYAASGPAGFLSLSQTGSFEIDQDQRILSRKEVCYDGSGSMFTMFGSKPTGAVASVSLDQQIISVDSEMLITRAVVSKKDLSGTVKGYFSVWRRSGGVYSGQ